MKSIMKKKVLWTEKTYQHGKKVLIIHYDDGTTKTKVQNPF